MKTGIVIIALALCGCGASVSLDPLGNFTISGTLPEKVIEMDK